MGFFLFGPARIALDKLIEREFRLMAYAVLTTSSMNCQGAENARLRNYRSSNYHINSWSTAVNK